MAEQEKMRAGAVSQMAVLVVGASFAGLATAYWLCRLGHAVTVVDIAPDLKRGGTPVDIRGGTLAIMKRMGLSEQVRARRLPLRPILFKDRHGNTLVGVPGQAEQAREEDGDCEIDRDVLLDILFQHVRNEVDVRFGDSILHLAQTPAGVEVGFASGLQGAYDFVVGCDGSHSAVRRTVFGAESSFLVFMQHYFAIAVVDRCLLDPHTTCILNAPGRALMLNSYDDKTDIALAFHAPHQIPYDYRDRARQRQIAAEQFAWLDWRREELAAALVDSPDFYFDQFCQIKMPAWHRGRVVLAGDAAYCASPAAGMGGSLALVGACALGDALQRYPDNLELAFQDYDKRVRPFVAQVQADAVASGLSMFVPRTEDAILQRNTALAAAGA